MRKLLNRRAEGMIFPCILIVILSMIVTMVIFFVSTVSMIKIQKENTKKVLDSYIIENAIEIYDSIKLGEDEQLNLNNSSFISKLSSFNSLDFHGNLLYAYDDRGNIRYYHTHPNLTSDQDLKVTAAYTLYVPIYFCGRTVATARIPVTIHAYYNEKF